MPRVRLGCSFQLGLLQNNENMHRVRLGSSFRLCLPRNSKKMHWVELGESGSELNHGISATLQPNPTPSVCEGETQDTAEQQPECCGLTTEQVSYRSGNTDDTKTMQLRRQCLCKSYNPPVLPSTPEIIYPPICERPSIHNAATKCPRHQQNGFQGEMRGTSSSSTTV